MSKSSRARRKNKRAVQKKRQKEAKRLLYAGFSEQGRRKGSVRARRAKKKGPKKPHSARLCGNPACVKCFGVSYKQFLGKGGVPVGMPQRMYIKWVEENK